MTMELFANGELVKAFLHGFLNDEHVHGVPLDALPLELDLTFETEQQSVEETADMIAFCAAMQCNTRRHSVSVLEAERTYSGGAHF